MSNSKKDKDGVIFLDNVKFTEEEIKSDEVIENKYENVANVLDGSVSIEIESSGLSEEIIKVVIEQEKEAIKYFENEIEVLKELFKKYDLNKKEKETLRGCILNYSYGIEKHKKGLDELQGQRKKILS